VSGAVLRRWLKVADPTALTARESLRGDLGYRERVGDVARSDVFGFLWEEETDPIGLLDRLCEHTNLLQNPNKHRREIRLPGQALTPRGNTWVLVTREEETERVEASLARHGGLAHPPRVRTGTLWELDLAGDPEERLHLAEEIAVCRSRRRGLLANPHVERAVVFGEPPAVGAVLSALELR
jgi:hypothetical protein